MEISDHHETLVALQHVKALVEISETHGDEAVVVTASTLEAYIHLQSEAPDYIMNSQRAIAKARSLQLKSSTFDIYEIWALLSCIDLACALLEYSPDQVSSKINSLQPLFDDLIPNKNLWTDDGVISIPLNEQSADRVNDFSCQLFTKASNGKVRFDLAWLPKEEGYVLAYLFSGISQVLKNPAETKCETLISEAKRMTDEVLEGKPVNEGGSLPKSASRMTMSRRLAWTRRLKWHVELYHAFIMCIRSDWKGARKTLTVLDKRIDAMQSSGLPQLARWTTYLHGMIEQGSGNTEAATQIFRSPLLLNSPKLSSAAKRAGPNTALDDLAVLSRLNLLLILRSPTVPPTDEIDELMSSLVTLLQSSHPNKALSAAQSLITSLINPSTTIIKKKTSIQAALNASRGVGNAQLLAMSMAAMVSMFFTEIMGRQAHAGRSTALALAERSQEPLWIAVASGIRLRGIVEAGDGENDAPPEREKIEKKLSAAMKKIPAGVLGDKMEV
jgi:hypothetical protein